MWFRFAVCQHLLKNPAVDATATTREGATAFHYLVRHKVQPAEEKVFWGVMELLVKKGCDVAALNRHGESTLHSACMRGNYKAVQFLLQQGEDKEE